MLDAWAWGKGQAMRSSEGCTNQVVKGRVYIRHGANVKRCSSEGCANEEVKGGLHIAGIDGYCWLLLEIAGIYLLYCQSNKITLCDSKVIYENESMHHNIILVETCIR